MTAQELQTVQDSAGKSRKRRCMVASMAHSRFPRGFPS